MAAHPRMQRQRGIVLIVGLVFLLVLTIIGVTALRTSTLEERMAGNMMSKTLAFQDAESAIASFINTINDTRLGDPGDGSNIGLSTQDDCGTDDTVDNLSNNPDLVSNETCRRFMGRSESARQVNTADGSQTSFSHFQIESTTTTKGNAKVTIDQGVAIRSPRAPNVSRESTPPTPSDP